MALACGKSFAQRPVAISWKIHDSPEVSTKSLQDHRKAQEFLDSTLWAHQAAGFLAAFWEVEERGDTLFAVLDKGPLIQEFRLSGHNVPDHWIREIGLPGNQFSDFVRWRSELLAFLEDSGYPFGSIRLGDLNRQEGILSARIVIDEGPMITWDSVQVSGSTKTSPRYLQNLSMLKIGEPFSQEEFLRASRQLARSPYFRLSAAPEISFQQRKAQPIFQLLDRNSNVLDGIIGILPNENEPGKVLITGQLDLELYHLGGRGRDVTVNWKRLNIETQSLDLTYRESFVLRSPLSFNLGFSLLKQDSTFLNRAFDLSFDYRPKRDLLLSFFTRRQASDLISSSDFSDLQELPEAADYRWNQYGLGADWNTLDDPQLPRKGARLQVKFAAGNKRILENTAIPEEIYEGLDLNTAQYSLQGHYEKHLYLKTSWGMWLRASGAWIQNDNLLLNDLFRLGGLKSIRGFNENFFYARSFAYLNFEQRLFFGERSYLMGFVDFGVLEDPYADQVRDLPLSTGTGINLDTGSGLFRFILGVGRSNQQPFSLSFARIHFGYVAQF
ncbi:BamA/TamA family outer membrane protein [Algoriphagus namhaensis]